MKSIKKIFLVSIVLFTFIITSLGDVTDDTDPNMCRENGQDVCWQDPCTYGGWDCILNKPDFGNGLRCGALASC